MRSSVCCAAAGAGAVPLPRSALLTARPLSSRLTSSSSSLPMLPCYIFRDIFTPYYFLYVINVNNGTYLVNKSQILFIRFLLLAFDNTNP